MQDACYYRPKHRSPYGQKLLTQQRTLETGAQRKPWMNTHLTKDGQEKKPYVGFMRIFGSRVIALNKKLDTTNSHPRERSLY